MSRITKINPSGTAQFIINSDISNNKKSIITISMDHSSEQIMGYNSRGVHTTK
jgi:hypothetical protein